MIFSELYGAYYNAVAKIIAAALKAPVSKTEIRKIIEEHAFSESAVAIEPALTQERWQLIRSDGATPIEHKPSMPLSTLQKRWLKAIMLDPRIKLFDFEIYGLDEVEPLFTPDDVYLFDKYADGDPYEDEGYISRFRLILDAIKRQYPLRIEAVGSKGSKSYSVVMPQFLEYSEKDDKFRLFTMGRRYGKTINLARILSCKPYCGKFESRPMQQISSSKSVVIELFDERNALERVMLHFAHFEKEAERLDNRRYRITIRYNKDDESEIVIRILSFGPFIKVVEPESFVLLIKERLKMQKGCELL